VADTNGSTTKDNSTGELVTTESRAPFYIWLKFAVRPTSKVFLSAWSKNRPMDYMWPRTEILRPAICLSI